MVAEGSGPILPSMPETGATAPHAGATRTVKSADALASLSRRRAVAQNSREDQLSSGDGRYLGPEGTKGEAAKVDPRDCLMETLVLRENQEGIRIRRTNNPCDHAKHLPRTICGRCDDGQAQRETVTRSSDRCRSSNVRRSSNLRGSGDVCGSGDRCASSKVRGSGDWCASGDVRGSGDLCVSGGCARKRRPMQEQRCA
jgi:hypothetical protein